MSQEIGGGATMNYQIFPEKKEAESLMEINGNIFQIKLTNGRGNYVIFQEIVREKSEQFID